MKRAFRLTLLLGLGLLGLEYLLGPEVVGMVLIALGIVVLAIFYVRLIVALGDILIGGKK